MGIQVKIKNTILTFSEWQSHDPSFMWVLPLFSEKKSDRSEIDDVLWDEGYGILLLYFDGWVIRFKTPMMYDLGKMYGSLYGSFHFDPIKYSTATDWKLHVEKFLHQINSLKVFL